MVGSPEDGLQPADGSVQKEGLGSVRTHGCLRAKSSVTEKGDEQLSTPQLYARVDGEKYSGKHGSSGPSWAGGGVLELKSGNYGLQSVAASDTFAVVENYRGA